MYRLFQAGRAHRPALLARQLRKHCFYARPPVLYDFAAFEKCKEHLQQRHSVQIQPLLRDFFRIQHAREAAYVEGDYYNWLNDNMASIHVAALLKENWSHKKTISKMEDTLCATYHDRQYSLGRAKNHKSTDSNLRLEVRPVWQVPYFIPLEITRDRRLLAGQSHWPNPVRRRNIASTARR
jgi:hypothetical protein